MCFQYDAFKKENPYMKPLRTFAVATLLAAVAFSMVSTPSALAAKTKKHGPKHAKKHATAPAQPETDKKS